MKVLFVLPFFIAGIAFANPSIDKKLDESANDKDKLICVEYIEFNPVTKERKVIRRVCVKKPKTEKPSKEDIDSRRRV
jgi:hypothetical protein